MSRFAPPPGTSDITSAEIPQWLMLENRAREIFALYGYGEIRTPIFEYTDVFEKGLGNETEVVKKEMYTFEDRGGRKLTLRPEGTAGVMRYMSGTEALNGIEQRVFYIGPMFRGERPAAGRRRQFHQIGVENVGRVHPNLDAECITMLMHYLKSLGITDAKLLINTRGEEADRAIGSALLHDYFAPHVDELCEDCKVRFQNNIWRILDCKAEQCQDLINHAPNTAEHFTEESRAYFAQVCQALDRAGIAYTVEPRLVRGLDYYVHTVFEITHTALGGQSAIAGGGRYQMQIAGCSKPLIGVGFAAGMERLLMVRDGLNLTQQADSVPEPIFILPMGEQSQEDCRKLCDQLRMENVPAMIEPESGKSVKSQMRTANRLKAPFVVLCGDDELAQNVVTVKDMRNATQQTVARAEVVQHLVHCYNVFKQGENA